MPNDSAAPVASIPRLIVGLIGACAAGGGLGVAMGRLKPDGGDAVEGAMLGVAPVVLAAALGVFVLAAPASRTAQRLGLSVLLASSVRLLTSLAMMLAAFFLVRPSPAPFFTAFAVGAIGCIGVESLWAVAALRRAPHRGAHPA